MVRLALAMGEGKARSMGLGSQAAFLSRVGSDPSCRGRRFQVEQLGTLPGSERMVMRTALVGDVCFHVQLEGEKSMCRMNTRRRIGAGDSRYRSRALALHTVRYQMADGKRGAARAGQLSLMSPDQRSP